MHGIISITLRVSAKYKPMITENDLPPTYLNKSIMDSFRPKLEKYYYDETKYNSYLEQLNITYPTIREKNEK